MKLLTVTQAASNGGGGYSHSQQMGSTASSPKGNSKTEPVKSATIHDGKCLTFRANANGSHVRSKTKQGRAMRNEARFKNVTNSLSADRFSGWWTTSSNEPPLTDASDIQVAVVAVSAETWPVTRFIKSLDRSCCCWKTLAFNRDGYNADVDYFGHLCCEVNSRDAGNGCC